MCSDSCTSLVFLWPNQAVLSVFMSAAALLSKHNADASIFQTAFFQENPRKIHESEHFSRKILGFGVENARKFMKWTMFASPQHPQTQKLCGKRSISTQKLQRKKHIFFTEIIFSRYFSHFSTSQNPKFRDLADLAMCTRLTRRLLINEVIGLRSQ